jgi:ribosomal protein S18 acetylase RimI-like enzyme
MNPQLRAFTGEPDLQAMAALTNAFPSTNLHVTDLPYRFSSWALDDPDNIALWVDDGGALLGWAILQTPFWTIDSACHPQAAPTLYPQILAWADARARQIAATPAGRPLWFVNVFSGQHDRIHALEAAGFAAQTDVGEDSWSKVLLRRDSRLPLPETALPEGFTIRPLAGAQEVDAYVALHQAVFESKNMTAAWRARTLARPEYLRALDLVAVAPDGRLAAFCIGWLHRGPGSEISGQIEPLGVHAGFRRQGLGRSILAAGLRRLQQHGAASVAVETDNYRDAAFALYTSVGFQVVEDVLVYRKEYGGP